MDLPEANKSIFWPNKIRPMRRHYCYMLRKRYNNPKTSILFLIIFHYSFIGIALTPSCLTLFKGALIGLSHPNSAHDRVRPSWLYFLFHDPLDPATTVVVVQGPCQHRQRRSPNTTLGAKLFCQLASSVTHCCVKRAG